MFNSKNLIVIISSLFLLTSCEEASNSSGDQSENVTIFRDAWGVPHIYGKEDGDTAFGMA